LKTAPVRRGGRDVLLLDELHPVGDELGPAVEAAGVHRPEAALHVGHHLVLGLPDQQRQDEEGGQHADGAQDDLEGRGSSGPGARAHRGPHDGSGTRAGAILRRLGAPPRPVRAGALGALAPAPSPGPGLAGPRARTNDLRSGVPSKPSGSEQRPHPEAGAVVEPGEVDPEHLVRLALVPGRAGHRGR
jgi:hypothetical protein